MLPALVFGIQPTYTLSILCWDPRCTLRRLRQGPFVERQTLRPHPPTQLWDSGRLVHATFYNTLQNSPEAGLKHKCKDVTFHASCPQRYIIDLTCGAQ
jgi:hypothetical protein